MQNANKPALLNTLDAIFEGIRKGSFIVFFLATILAAVFYYTYVVNGVFYAETTAVVAAFLYITISGIKKAMTASFNNAVKKAISAKKAAEKKPEQDPENVTVRASRKKKAPARKEEEAEEQTEVEVPLWANEQVAPNN